MDLEEAWRIRRELEAADLASLHQEGLRMEFLDVDAVLGAVDPDDLKRHALPLLDDHCGGRELIDRDLPAAVLVGRFLHVAPALGKRVSGKRLLVHRYAALGLD